MADILHRLRVNASPEDVLRALLDHDFLGSEWKRARVAALAARHDGPRRKLAWRCVDGAPDWIGTEITFDFQPFAGGTIVRFAHRHWRAPTDAMADCATAWAQVLFRLKSWVETPEPDDIAIGI